MAVVTAAAHKLKDLEQLIITHSARAIPTTLLVLKVEDEKHGCDGRDSGGGGGGGGGDDYEGKRQRAQYNSGGYLSHDERQRGQQRRRRRRRRRRRQRLREPVPAHGNGSETADAKAAQVAAAAAAGH